MFYACVLSYTRLRKLPTSVDCISVVHLVRAVHHSRHLAHEIVPSAVVQRNFAVRLESERNVVRWLHCYLDDWRLGQPATKQ